MGKLEFFEVKFDAPNAVYTAGNTLTGKVTVKLRESMKMRGLRIQLKGEADVHWTERHTSGSGNNRHTRTVHYRNHEEYFNMIVTLYGKAPGAGGDDLMHPPGMKEYPFWIQLPPALPSSFEGQCGYVRYSGKAVIDKPWKFDHTTKTGFTVQSLLDLNIQPNILQPVSNSKQKTLCCLCCESAPIVGSITLPKTGFVPGEYIPLQAEIKNGSGRVMDCSKMILKQAIQFHSTSKTRTINRVVCETRHGPIQGGDEDQWSNTYMQVPPLPPSMLVGCRIIDIHYTLQLTVDPSGMSFDLDVPLNVIIGTIPLVNNFSLPPQQQAAFSQPALPNVEPSAPPAPAFTAPPPSYAQCAFGATNIRDEDESEHTQGNLNYAPVYQFYGQAQYAPPPSQPDFKNVQ